MKVRLDEWLEKEFEPAPAIRTARAWLREGKIFAALVKIGRAYYGDTKSIFNDGQIKKRLAQRIPQ